MRRSIRWPGRKLRARLGLLLLGIVALLGCGCRVSEEDVMKGCHQLLDANAFSEAILTCGSIFEETHLPQAAVATARAHWALEQGEEVLAWAERVGEDDRAHEIWSLVAEVHHQRQDLASTYEALERAQAAQASLEDFEQQTRTAYDVHRLAWSKGDLRRAFEAARSVYESGARTERSAEWQGSALQLLANILNDVGDLERADEVVRLAAEHLGNDHPRIPYVLVTQGSILLGRKRYALARQALEKALSLATDETQPWVRWARLNLAETSLDEGSSAVGQEHLERLFELAGGDPSPWLLYLNARWLRHQGERDAALNDLERALAQEPIANLAWRFEQERGELLVDLGRSDAARAAFEKAIQLLEQLRLDLEWNELKASLLERRRQPYEALVRLFLSQHQIHDTLATIERAKARTFLDAFIRQDPDESAFVDATSAWVGSAQVIERVDGLRTLLPEMHRSSVVQPQPVDRLLEHLGQRHALVYFRAGEELWLLVIRGGVPQAFLLNESSSEVVRRVRQFLARPEDRELATGLGSLLLPELALPAEGTPIYLVTDGELGQIPFAALRIEGRFLVERHALAYAPSLTGLLALEERPRKGEDRHLVFGDPRLDLPAARVEAERVGERLAAEVFLGEAATATEFHRARQASILHLAMHSGIRSGQPWIALADREVTASEIIAGRIGPEVAVLASCASGARRGQGVWGSLASAFLIAGSRVTLASLWSLEDETTFDFIDELYVHDVNGNAAQALAKVQRNHIRDGEPISQWAPFVVFGAP